jgi:hypothetical protein
MHRVMENLSPYLCKCDSNETKGKDDWKIVAVCTIGDGRQKINPRTSVLSWL